MSLEPKRTAGSGGAGAGGVLVEDNVWEFGFYNTVKSQQEGIKEFNV